MNCVYPSFVIDHCYFLRSKVYNAKGHQCHVSVECKKTGVFRNNSKM